MEASKRIIVNTIVQYGKSVVNICLSLYSTRLVLDALNISDYGIYSVVGGVVSILGYLTNSLVVTTQRYLSYHQGAADNEQVRKVFANSLLIHLMFGVAICLILLPLENLLINHFLNIDPLRMQAAGAVYVTMVFMLFATVMTSPFKALLIAHENIVYISVIEVIDGVLKLVLALSLAFIGLDKLVFYAIGMTSVITFNLLAYIVYDYFKYEESHYRLGKKNYDKAIIRQLLGFAGWTTYGMVAGICQSQGLTVVFNKFFGTTINAAFGIGTQVNGAVRFVSTSILNAMNPQIMKAEGSHDREKMLSLAGKESKFSTALMMIISIPVMIELPDILAFWLKVVPPYTTTFCRALMLAFVVDQMTLGLHAANQATGKLKYYSLLTYTPKMMPHSVGNFQGRWRTSSYDGHLRVYGTRSFVITAALHEILGWAQCYPICQGFPYAALTFGHGRHACKRGLYRVLRISVQIPFYSISCCDHWHNIAFHIHA